MTGGTMDGARTEDDAAPEAKAGGKRAITKEANRKAILDAARQVFAELSYGGATVRDIIRRTGLAAGTFYNYFKSKEEVFEALLDDRAASIRPQLRAVRMEATTFEEFVLRSFEAYFAYVAENRNTFAVVRRNAGTVRMRLDTPEVAAGFAELNADLRAAMERGLVAAIDPDLLTAAFTGVAFELGDVMLRRDPVDVSGTARFATRLFMGGIPALTQE